MRNQFRINDNLTFTGTILVSLLLVITVFSRMIPTDYDIFFNSDMLYLPSLFRDLFTDHNSLKGWNVSPSPAFLPDMTLYFAGMFLFQDFIVVSLVFGLVQYAGILLLMAFVFKMIIPQRPLFYASASSVLMMLFLFASALNKDFLFTFFLVSNTFHTGAFVMALICLAFTFHFLKYQRKASLVFIFLLSILAIISDRLFIIMYLAPFILISGFYVFGNDRKKFLQLLLTTVVALIAGITAFNLISSSGYIYLAKPHKMLDLSNSWSSFLLLMDQMGTYLGQMNFKTVIIILSLISFLVTVFLVVKDFFLRKEKRGELTTIYGLFSVLFTVFVFGAPVLSGSYTGWDTLRYNIGAFYLSVLNVGFLLFLLSEKGKSSAFSGKRIQILIMVILVFAAFTIGLRFSAKGLKDYFGYYPEVVKDIDNVAQTENLKLGVGSYWLAKYTTMFSKTGLVVHPVFDPIAPYHHITNQNWFYADTAVYNFIILNRFGEPEAYKKFFGDSLPEIIQGYARIVKVPPFRFNPENYQPYYADTTAINSK